MLTTLLRLNIKDWFIIISLFILFLCILEIRKLKKLITREAQRRLIPQLNLELVVDLYSQDTGLYLKNESFFLAKDIKIEEVAWIMADAGFDVNLILRFTDIDFIKPNEKIKLNFEVLDEEHNSQPQITDRIIPHLISPTFKTKIYYSNVENVRFCAVFAKKRTEFYVEKVNLLP